MVAGETPRPMAEATSYAADDPESEARAPEEDMGDLLHVITDAPEHWAQPHSSALRRPTFWALQTIPLTILLAMFGLAIRRKAAERAARPVAEPPRTAAVILDEIRHDTGDDRRRFYRRVSEFLDRAAIPNSELSERVRREAFSSLGAGSASTGTGREAAGDVSAAERRDVIAFLEPLLSRQ